MDYRVGEQFAVVFEFEVVLDLMIHRRDRLFVGTEHFFVFFSFGHKLTISSALSMSKNFSLLSSAAD